MYVLKIDLPTGVAYFTGKKRVVQGSESPGLTNILSEARFFEEEAEAAKFCKMLIKKYDMEFYYSSMTSGEDSSEEDEFVVQLTEDLEQQVRDETEGEV